MLERRDEAVAHPSRFADSVAKMEDFDGKKARSDRRVKPKLLRLYGVPPEKLCDYPIRIRRVVAARDCHHPTVATRSAEKREAQSLQR